MLQLAFFLNLQKTFGTVDHEILLYKLHIFGIRDTVLDWFRITDSSTLHLLIFHLIMASLLVVFPSISHGSSAIFVVRQRYSELLS